MPVFDTPQPIDLDLAVGMGYVEVVASDRTDTVAEVVPSNPRRGGDASLARDSTMTMVEGRLRITVPKRLSLLGPGDSVDVRVELPTGSRVSIDCAYGTVRARGGLGSSRVSNAYGAITIERTGDLTLKAPYGEVEVDEVGGDLHLTAGHGRHRIGRITGTVDVKGSHGDVDLGDVGGDIEVRSSGSVTVGRAGGNVSVQTAYGVVRVREVSGGTVRLENGYAEVQVGVPEGIAAWVDALSQHGVVRNELTAEAGPEGSKGTVELRLRASYGDIIITRATGGARQ